MFSIKTFKFVIRALVSLVLIAVIYSKADLPSLWTVLKTVSWSTALLVAILYTFGQIISAIKWRIISRGVGLERRLSDILRAYFFGMFINTFGLGTVGGDVARSLALMPKKGKRAAALATVVADRAQGLLVLASIGAISILIVRPEALEPLGGKLAIPAVLCLGTGWWLGPKILTRIFPKGHRFGTAAEQVSLAFPTKLKPLLTITVISAFFHSIQIFMHYCIAQELGTGLTLAYLFATVPIVNIAASLPLSINGIGIREALYVYLFMPVGVSQEAAIAFGAIWILTVTIVSAIGGLVVGLSTDVPTLTSSEDEDTAINTNKESDMPVAIKIAKNP